MRTIYLECNSGASGDMILGALSELLDDPFEFKDMINSIGIPGVETKIEKSETFGITGLRVHISIGGTIEGHGHEDHHHEHVHHHMSDISGIIDGLKVSDKVKEDAKNIYRSIAEAESKAHGKPVELIHFHEVGALDAVADVVGACMLFEKLHPDCVIASPVRTGYGYVKCAHGLLPVPAPATAHLLNGIPTYAGDTEGEFCTPTGAAILRYFVDRFEHMPTMTFDSVGCGIGYKEFRHANILRAFSGDTENDLPVIKEICCNIDDMMPEDLGGIIDLLLSNKALDAFIKPCIMKKGRPGFELTCLCRKENLNSIAKLILEHTSTIGLRVHDCERYAMASRFEKTETPYGEIRMKISEGFGIIKQKPEYEDLQEAASKNGISVIEVRNSIKNPDA